MEPTEISYQTLKNELEKIANDLAKLKKIDQYKKLLKLTQEQSDISLTDSLEGILGAIQILNRELENGT